MFPIRDLEALQRRLEPLRRRLVSHPFYGSLGTLDCVRRFQTHHVFAVWDFMSLLKALQRGLTCVDEVWRPRGSAIARRLVNEIVVGEESDVDGTGYASHFELYRRAMRETGADTGPIDRVLARLDAGEDVFAALATAPPPARRFCEVTFTLVRSGSLPAIAAAFLFGREDVIPDMFRHLIVDLHARHPGGLPTLVDYLQRHVELDGERHGPMAAQLLTELCGDDLAAWQQAADGALRAIEARLRLWDELHAQVVARAIADRPIVVSPVAACTTAGAPAAGPAADRAVITGEA